jgi:hypothetical protein
MRRYSAVLMILMGISLSSCVTNKEFIKEVPTLQLRRLDQSDIRKISSREYENPYLEPVSLFKGKLNEFIVFELKVNSKKSLNISLLGKLTSLDGQKLLAPLFDKDQLVDYWETYSHRISVEDNVALEKKKNLIQTSYLPAQDFIHKAGMRGYYLVFIGTYPPVRPAKVDISVYTEDGEILNYLSEL